MGCSSSNNVEEIVVFDCREHSKTVSGTNFVSFIKKVSETISSKSKNSNATKFTIKNNKVVSITTVCVTCISKTVIAKRIEVYATQPEQLIKDLETLYKIFIK